MVKRRSSKRYSRKKSSYKRSNKKRRTTRKKYTRRSEKKIYSARRFTKSKKLSKRKGPAYHAGAFKGEIMKGQDKHLWKSVSYNGIYRWKRI